MDRVVLIFSVHPANISFRIWKFFVFRSLVILSENIENLELIIGKEKEMYSIRFFDKRPNCAFEMRNIGAKLRGNSFLFVKESHDQRNVFTFFHSLAVSKDQSLECKSEWTFAGSSWNYILCERCSSIAWRGAIEDRARRYDYFLLTTSDSRRTINEWTRNGTVELHSVYYRNFCIISYSL